MKMWTDEALRGSQQVQTLHKHYRKTPGIPWEVKGKFIVSLVCSTSGYDSRENENTQHAYGLSFKLQCE